mmetsp:Transcript_37534/g.82197  ORF Transcript_37534/g.82197 Transcript_37534/m.82197 type:complete len:228 (-) Transcript_37534:218-901(-)
MRSITLLIVSFGSLATVAMVTSPRVNLIIPTPTAKLPPSPSPESDTSPPAEPWLDSNASVSACGRVVRGSSALLLVVFVASSLGAAASGEASCASGRWFPPFVEAAAAPAAAPAAATCRAVEGGGGGCFLPNRLKAAAAEGAVRPGCSRARTSVRSFSTITLFFNLAKSNGVLPSPLTGAMSAPALISNRTTRSCPQLLALWRGVQPSSSTASTLPPRAINIPTTLS